MYKKVCTLAKTIVASRAAWFSYLLWNKELRTGTICALHSIEIQAHLWDAV
jgi:hypothetical protein